MDTPLNHGEHEEFRRTVEAEFKEVQAENNRQNRRIELLEQQSKELTSLTFSVQELAKNMTAMVQTQKEAERRLDELEDRDAKKWQSTMKYLGTFVVGVLTAIVGAYIRALMGI
ncbi:MAG: hypothetical protein LUI14_14610 [Lachnospiraceae bacterium]|nr:hypothetical protein [Lachnospiraceae bacterium]